jgi:hypothetical protein
VNDLAYLHEKLPWKLSILLNPEGSKNKIHVLIDFKERRSNCDKDDPSRYR